MFISRQKINFNLQIFLEILQNCYFRYLGHAWHDIPRVIPSNSLKTFVFICRQKINFIPHVFLKILQRYENLSFWVLWVCLAMYTQNGSINLQKTLMFINMPKINFIIHSFLVILHFKESWNLIADSITQEPEFYQIWDW